ncbi:MAG: ribonuclease H-like domain-containing protein [Holosporales bacterium]|nr:ribonuclease H-like domain-containing protein [Holosporales bacterium]
MIYTYKNDLPDSFFSNLESLAIDTETMGLLPHRDRLCVAQFSIGDGNSHIVQFDNYTLSCNIKKMLSNDKILKIFHYARFDVTTLYKHLEIMTKNIYCTKIASKLVRTYTSKHGLFEICKELLGVEISKGQTCSDWGNENLTKEQEEYAANDVIYLHRLKERLDIMLKREKRVALAKSCFAFLETRVMLDLMAGENYDIFAHGV